MYIKTIIAIIFILFWIYGVFASDIIKSIDCINNWKISQCNEDEIKKDIFLIENRLEILKLQLENYKKSIELLDIQYEQCLMIYNNTGGWGWNHNCRKNNEYDEIKNKIDLVKNDISKRKNQIKELSNLLNIVIENKKRERELKIELEKNIELAEENLQLWIKNLDQNLQASMNYFYSSCRFKKTFDCLYYLGYSYDKKSEVYKYWTRDSFIYGRFTHYRDIGLTHLEESLEFADNDEQILKAKTLIKEIESFDFYGTELKNTNTKEERIEESKTSNEEIKNTDQEDTKQQKVNIKYEANIIIERLDNITQNIEKRRVLSLQRRLITALEKINNRQRNEIIEEVIQILKNRTQ